MIRGKIQVDNTNRFSIMFRKKAMKTSYKITNLIR